MKRKMCAPDRTQAQPTRNVLTTELFSYRHILISRSIQENVKNLLRSLLTSKPNESECLRNYAYD